MNGVNFYQRKGADFSSILCSHFVNLCVQANKPEIVSNMIAQPHHRIGAWVSRKANLSLLNSLAKVDDVDSMINVASATLKKGLIVQSQESISVLLSKVQNAEQFDTVMDIAAKTLRPEELEAVKSKFPAFASAEPVAEPAVETVADASA